MERRKTILIIDDTKSNRAVLSDIFYRNYNILLASTGKEGLEILEEKAENIDLVLLDVDMKDFDGFAVLRVMKAHGLTQNIPVIFITAEQTEYLMKKSYGYGVSDIISKPFNAEITRRRIKNILDLYNRQQNLKQLVEQQTQMIKNQSRLLIDALSSIIEFKNQESGQHILRIRIATKFLLEKLSEKYKEYKLSANQIELIAEAACLHDAGKIAIPNEILNKPARLTKEEFEIIKTHSTVGEEIVQKLKNIRSKQYMDYCMDICKHHHERWDGSGYPDGLMGNEISLWAQVVSMADVYDALTNIRVYKPAYSHEESVKMIVNGECGVFNPKLLEVFIQNEQDLFKLVVSETVTAEISELWENPDDLISKESSLEKTLRYLEQERKKYRVVAEMSDDIIFDYDFKEDMISFSEKAEEIFGIKIIIEKAKNAILNYDAVHSDDKLILRQVLESLNENNTKARFSLRLKTRTGGYRNFNVFISSIWNSEQDNDCISIIGKLTNNEKFTEIEQEQKIEKDELTKLIKKESFYIKCKSLMVNGGGEVSSLLHLDLDNFKEINDHFGHLHGDYILKEVSSVIRSCIRKTDLVSRIGGDEFIIFLHNIGDNKVGEEKASTICKEISNNKNISGISACIGVAHTPSDSTDFEELKSKAENALYFAKKSGKSKYSVYQSGKTNDFFRAMLASINADNE